MTALSQLTSAGLVLPVAFVLAVAALLELRNAARRGETRRVGAGARR
ncbi:hypothetical protein [Yinghuangia seranimata]|nr:hypothetical protein [Yinghuangia seranimata]MDI2130284.1 hypothetical protein [Yinghuangia seranimata]